MIILDMGLDGKNKMTSSLFELFINAKINLLKFVNIKLEDLLVILLIKGKNIFWQKNS